MSYFSNMTAFKKRYLPIFIIMAIVTLIEIVFLILFPTISKNILLSPGTKSKKSGWPLTISAPYIDMSLWTEPANAYSINGAPNLEKLSEDSGFNYFNLGFIQPDQQKPLENDGTIRWGWGGYYSLGKNGGNNAQYQGIVSSMEKLRKKGGDYTVSIGGQAGDAPWVVTQNQTALENFYDDVISTYLVKRLDLDIEESNQDEDQNQINARAIKAIQDKTNVEITLTIPIMPYGWEDKQIKIINAYLDAGVDIAIINSMTMCYGTGVGENEDYGTASVRAISSSIPMLKKLYSDHGFELTDSQAYLKTGATFSIGFESNLYPIFTTEMADTVVTDAISNSYGMVSMWSVGRDAMLETNKAISTPFAYSNILKKYKIN